jgi:hypothetical protein
MVVDSAGSIVMGGGPLLARPLPIPGQEIRDPPGRMILQSQDIGEPSLRIDVVELGDLDHPRTRTVSGVQEGRASFDAW